MKKIGDIQQEIGEVSGSFYLVKSYILAGIFFIMAIGFIIVSFIPTEISNNKKCSINSDCDQLTEQCKNGKCFSIGKKRRFWFLLFAIFFILIGIAIIFTGRTYDNFVHENRENAQIGAVVTEGNILLDILK